MKKVLIVLGKMIIAFILAAIAIVMTINSNLGLSPWDVLHQGISKISFMTIGQASIFVGLAVIVISSFMGVSLGIATVVNTVMIGYVIDIVIKLGFIPLCQNIYSGIIMMLGGIFLLSFATYLYMSCGLGCGPRDGLMVALTKKTKYPVGLIRGVMEISVMSIGYLLGGFVGIGTVITAFGTGYFIKVIFKMFKFNVKKHEHMNIKEGLIWIRTSLKQGA